MRISIILGSLWLLLSSQMVNAAPIIGSCENYDFPVEGDVISTNLSIRALRLNAPVYADANGTTATKKLEFGHALIPVKLSNPRQRVQIRDMGAANPLGWMDERDLLCAYRPLVGEKGLERKAFIKTPRTAEASLNSVTAYPMPQGNDCGFGCNQLSRFELYFIFAEDTQNKRYLVSDVYNLAMPNLPSLIGWVDFDKSIVWNTTLGMRPRVHISAYHQQGDENNPNRKKGVELDGGNIWHTLPIHIPLLDIENSYYRVAAPGIGMQGFKPLNTEVLTALKQVDVFFLIDGTATMAPYIQAAKEVVLEIGTNLRNEPAYKETSFRFGFRIYRDTYADALVKDGRPLCKGGICEGMPLSAGTCEANEETVNQNWQGFVKQIAEVKETVDDKDDYPEKLFDGLRRATQDVASCEQRTKLIFVVGDHGDKQPTVPQDIINNLKRNFKRAIVVFIQTANNEKILKKSEFYKVAYDSFKTQGLTLIKGLLPADFQGQAIEPEDYFLSLDEVTLLPAKIFKLVSEYSPSDVVNEVAQALRGGDALQNILAKLMKKGDMPVLYWQWVEDAACQALGKQCQTAVDHQVNEFFIPVSKEKIQEEVWMNADSLDKWIALLRPFEDIQGLPISEQRGKFADLLLEQVQNILGGPQLREDETLGKQFESLMMKRKDALPVRENSPLLQYSLKEIRSEISADCELPRLIEWVKGIRQILLKISGKPTLEVSFTLADYPASACAVTPKGQRIPKLVAEQRQPLGPNDEYRYDHNFRGQTIYWLPVDFLP
ncbi:MAG: hypothetical protein BWK79_08950 [Beggiatoa sp. IS2]|nr:MAG: hypothetical protein BWK79_08950 [Beggiatoa sp. IS2]